MQQYHWIIDPGHGCLTEDRHTPQFTDGSVYHEYEFNYSVAEHLCSLLHFHDIAHSQTILDPSGVSNSLNRRIKVANNYPSKYPKYLLSIHSNLSKPEYSWQTKDHGIEAWYAHNSYWGKKYAEMFCRELNEKNGLNNRGAKSKANNPYYLMSMSDMPCIVLEIGFLNHPEEINYLMDPGAQQAIAGSIADVIRKINHLD